MHRYCPPFTCAQCLWAICLISPYCEGCIHCLDSEDCLFRNFIKRDELSFEWEEEVQDDKLLHPTPSGFYDELHNLVASHPPPRVCCPPPCHPRMAIATSL